MNDSDRFLVVRQRFLPMLRAVAEELADRTVPGYPIVIDDPEQGMVGIALAPGFSLAVERQGDRLQLVRQVVQHRTLVHTAAGREWFGGQPREVREDLDVDRTDVPLRDELARLLAAWHKHPLIIRQSDS